MDSCPRACRSERDPQRVQRSQLGLAGRGSKRAAAERRKQGPRAVVVATAEPRAVGRTAAGQAPVAVPMPVPAAAQPPEVAARERAGERRRPAEELPRRPAECRNTSRICWWAGSSRRTACTRSCEKLPMLELSRAHLHGVARAAYPDYRVFTQ